jgi:hypothetical protein
MYARRSSPVVSTWKSSSSFFSYSRDLSYHELHSKTSTNASMHPVTRSSARASSSASSTTSRSTFLRHARLPLRLPCERCEGAPTVEVDAFVEFSVAVAPADAAFEETAMAGNRETCGKTDAREDRRPRALRRSATRPPHSQLVAAFLLSWARRCSLSLYHLHTFLNEQHYP